MWGNIRGDKYWKKLSELSEEQGQLEARWYDPGMGLV
jgi:hypothetical protein